MRCYFKAPSTLLYSHHIQRDSLWYLIILLVRSANGFPVMTGVVPGLAGESNGVAEIIVYTAG